MLVMAEVILNGITKTYPGGLVAVRNFDLNVAGRGRRPNDGNYSHESSV